MTDVILTRDELALIEHLRDVPRSATRDELTGLIRDLIDFVRDPRCPEAQGDGVPCASVEIACEDCRHVVAVLAAVHQRLGSASERAAGSIPASREITQERRPT